MVQAEFQVQDGRGLVQIVQSAELPKLFKVTSPRPGLFFRIEVHFFQVRLGKLRSGRVEGAFHGGTGPGLAAGVSMAFTAGEGVGVSTSFTERVGGGVSLACTRAVSGGAACVLASSSSLAPIFARASEIAAMFASFREIATASCPRSSVFRTAWSWSRTGGGDPKLFSTKTGGGGDTDVSSSKPGRGGEPERRVCAFEFVMIQELVKCCSVNESIGQTRSESVN